MLSILDPSQASKLLPRQNMPIMDVCQFLPLPFCYVDKHDCMHIHAYLNQYVSNFASKYLCFPLTSFTCSVDISHCKHLKIQAISGQLYLDNMSLLDSEIAIKLSNYTYASLQPS